MYMSAGVTTPPQARVWGYGSGRPGAGWPLVWGYALGARSAPPPYHTPRVTESRVAAASLLAARTSPPQTKESYFYTYYPMQQAAVLFPYQTWCG